MANFKPTSWHGIDLEPGQFVTSISSLSKFSGLSTQRVRTSLERLKSTHEITSESTSTYTLVTVANWAKYQNNDDMLTNQLTNDLTNEQQTNNKQITNDQQQRKKDKNDKKEKKSFEHDSKAYQLCEWLDEDLCKRMPARKRTSETIMQKWADAFDKVNRIDGYDWELINDVYYFSQSVDFWKPIILTGMKFREKFETMYSQMQSKNHSQMGGK